MKQSIRAAVSAIALGIGAPSFAEIQSAKVTGGEVAGTANNGISSFKGLPFAASAAGDNRWRSPQPVKPWSGVRKADEFAPGCVQDANMIRIFGGDTNFSEDCLYLNVWTPAKSASEKLPVMVWIYGGAFAGGQTSLPVYDGSRLAEKGVVVVSVAYRVGPFGFLASPELSKESGHGSGNYGLEDQIAGLKWVRQNVAKFGGDPARVTLFGESAGAISVSMLAASPLAKGLFAGAISESGGNFGPAKTGNEGGVNVPPLKIAEASGQKFLSGLGATDLKSARALPASKIQAAIGPGFGGFWPVFDGHVLPGDQYELYQAGKFNDTPILIGTNSDEGALFTPPNVTAAMFEQQIRAGYGEQAEAILKVNPHATAAEARTAAKNVFRETAFAWPTWAWARLQSRQGKHKVFVYYFDHRTPQAPDGANHGAEIPFVFRNQAPPFGATTPEEVALSDTISTYWTNFAKSGDPNGAGLTKWPAFTETSQQVLAFDQTANVKPIPNLQQLQAFETYYTWRRQQAQRK
jgi:para-nitrobenzyl esterase